MSDRATVNKGISRQQERAELTRSRLIQSAEKIFARDGFEAAKLEEIAADAGYTRGAFYAHFDSKEDLFFALLEREITSRIEKLDKQIDRQPEPAAKLEILRDFLLSTCLDRRWSLLALEFKLFAIRHPEVKTRLAAMNRRFIFSKASGLAGIFKALHRKLPASAHALALSLSTFTNSLTLEYLLDRSMMPDEDARKILKIFFDCVMGMPPE